MTPLEWVGAIVAVLVALGIAAFGIAHLYAVIWNHLDRLLWRRAEQRTRERGVQMKHQHWWWETPEQAAVWMACSDHMAEGNYPSIDTVRDKTYPRMLAEVVQMRSADSGTKS